ncbi:MAG: hypothetical protein KDH92_14040, partial [Chloroflexi bacterium]|nr:hypothetical protein [Chloroflexota bacterium]
MQTFVGAEQGCLRIQNLSPDRATNVRASGLDQHGRHPFRDGSVFLAPGLDSNTINCGWHSVEAVKGDVSYAMVLRADVAIGTLLSTHWAEMEASTYLGPTYPGDRVIVPIFAEYRLALPHAALGRSAARLSSVVHVQNTDPDEAVRARIRIRDAQGQLVSDSTVEIPAGNSVTLDQREGSPLTALPSRMVGTFEASADKELAVSSHVDVAGWYRAVLAFEGVPAQLASTTRFLPLLGYGRQSSRIAVLNPGGREARVSLRHSANRDASGQACVAGDLDRRAGTVVVPPGGLAFIPGDDSGSTEPVGNCLASAILRSDVPVLAAVVMTLDSPQADTADPETLGYIAPDLDDTGSRIALPKLRYGAYGMSAIQIMNPGAEPADLVLELLPEFGDEPLACDACSIRLAAGASQLLYLGNFTDLPRGAYRGALQSSAPLL